jgi:aspartyl-tRNA(Asn)/glutamyl-tRNA(Gln) amidotransferase subunit C
MANFSKKELLKLAGLSSLQLEEDEIEALRDSLSKTIDYTDQLESFQSTEEHDAVKTINVFREDKAIQKDSAPLLKQAPEKKATYFVVPKILD